MFLQTVGQTQGDEESLITGSNEKIQQRQYNIVYTFSDEYQKLISLCVNVDLSVWSLAKDLVSTSS